jgi:UDP-2,4-diacetamido-2,4,6-trideoxy-beta-L-altropyranose hydrolase
MKVVIRVDASINIGSGHVMRCLVLAEELRKRGHIVSFVCRYLDGDMITYIKSCDFTVFALPKVINLKPRNSSDYSSWLQVSESDDAIDFLLQIKDCDVVIIDHYGINSDWESLVNRQLTCKIIVIDDLNRHHNADLILDQNLWPDMTSRYSHCVADKLLGPDYALLRPAFKQLKSKNINKEEQVLAFFGGTDPTGECLKLIKAIQTLGDLPFKVLIVTGFINPNKEKLLQLNGSYFDVKTHIDNFEYELKISRYVFGASGVSNWERFCLELPTTIVSVAENQEALSAYLYEINAVRYLGHGGLTTKNTYSKELKYLKNNWNVIKYNNVINVDGFGSMRVVKAIEDINYEV